MNSFWQAKRLPALVCLLVSFSFWATSRAAENLLPRVEVVSVRRIYDIGRHNAFTDLCRYNDRLYLTFRSCQDGHGVHPTSSIIVMVSDDGQQWQQVHRFNVALRDVRDPHFLVFQEKLFVYTGTWYCGETAPKHRSYNQLLGYAAWTDDGKTWSDPTMLEGTYGHYVWRAASYGGKAYLCARRKHQFAEHKTNDQLDWLYEAALLESDDGLIWRKRGLLQEHYGDETALLFEKDGSLLALSRTRGNRKAQIGRLDPPYHRTTRIELDRSIGGPLLAKWGEHYLVGGRKTITGKAVCSLYWLTGSDLHEFAELPSGGDCSYPGFVQMGPQRALFSYYSSHEKDADGKAFTAIYLAELKLLP